MKVGKDPFLAGIFPSKEATPRARMLRQAFVDRGRRDCDGLVALLLGLSWWRTGGGLLV